MQQKIILKDKMKKINKCKGLSIVPGYILHGYKSNKEIYALKNN